MLHQIRRSQRPQAFRYETPTSLAPGLAVFDRQAGQLGAKTSAETRWRFDWTNIGDRQASSSASTRTNAATTLTDCVPRLLKRGESCASCRIHAIAEAEFSGSWMKVGYRIWLAAGCFWASACLPGIASAQGADPPVQASSRATPQLSADGRRTVVRPMLDRAPGTRGDPLRSLTLLPGVGQPAPANAGGFPIRGGAPEDSAVLLSGLPISMPFHLGAITSFMPAHWIERVDVHPSNYPARYGRRMSGIVDLQLKDLNPAGPWGRLDVNLLDASLVVEAPLGRALSVGLGARRSHLKLLRPFIEDEAVQLQSTPSYSDYQWLTVFRPNRRDRLRLLVFGTADDVQIRAPEGAAQPSEPLSMHSSLHRAQLSWQRHGGFFRQDIEIAVGQEDRRIMAGPALFALDGLEALGRAEWEVQLSHRVRVTAGAEVASAPSHLRYIGPPPVPRSNHPLGELSTAPALEAQQVLQTDERRFRFRPALYLDAEFQLSPLRLTLGNRVDYDHSTRSYSYDPRIMLQHRLNEGLALRAAAGVFSQPPPLLASDPILGNPNLLPLRTVHLSGGLDVQPNADLLIRADAFYKHLSRDVIATLTGERPGFSNGGDGRMYGVELFSSLSLDDDFTGQLSYTWSRSERAIYGPQYLPFAYDQPHLLALSGSYRAADGWEFGATFRLASGRPRTPIPSGSDGNVRPASYDLDGGYYVPVYQQLNSTRNPWSHQLDVRIQKKWQFSAWSLAAYLDVQNAYNARFVEGRQYSYNYEQSAPLLSLPLLPTVGLRGEL